jgi:hypothetical protein
MRLAEAHEPSVCLIQVNQQFWSPSRLDRLGATWIENMLMVFEPIPIASNQDAITWAGGTVSITNMLMVFELVLVASNLCFHAG